MPKAVTINAVVNKLVERTNTDTRRLRLLEQKAEILSTRLASAEQAALAAQETAKKSATELGARIDAQARLLAELQAALKEVIEQLKRSATTADVKELEALLELYDPLKSSFVTREEVQRMLARR